MSLKNGILASLYRYESARIFWNSRRISIFPSQYFELFEKRFYQSDLVKLYVAIPWKEVIKEFGIKENVIGTPFVFSCTGKNCFDVFEELFRFIGSSVCTSLTFVLSCVEKRLIRLNLELKWIRSNWRSQFCRTFELWCPQWRYSV